MAFIGYQAKSDIEEVFIIRPCSVLCKTVPVITGERIGLASDMAYKDLNLKISLALLQFRVKYGMEALLVTKVQNVQMLFKTRFRSKESKFRHNRNRIYVLLPQSLVHSIMQLPRWLLSSDRP